MCQGSHLWIPIITISSPENWKRLSLKVALSAQHSPVCKDLQSILDILRLWHPKGVQVTGWLPSPSASSTADQELPARPKISCGTLHRFAQHKHAQTDCSARRFAVTKANMESLIRTRASSKSWKRKGCSTQSGDLWPDFSKPWKHALNCKPGWNCIWICHTPSWYSYILMILPLWRQTKRSTRSTQSTSWKFVSNGTHQVSGPGVCVKLLRLVRLPLTKSGERHADQLMGINSDKQW